MSDGNNLIRFNGHPSGFIDTDNGVTALAYLPAILALSRTRGPLNGHDGGLFQTDTAGLGRLVDMAEGYLFDIVEMIGTLLSCSDTGELNPDLFRRVGFLLRGLSELREEVAAVRSDAAYQIKEGWHVNAKP